MRSCIREQRDRLESEGLDVSRILDGVSETPVAAETLRNFGTIVGSRPGDGKTQPTGHTRG